MQNRSRDVAATAFFWLVFSTVDTALRFLLLDSVAAGAATHVASALPGGSPAATMLAAQGSSGHSMTRSGSVSLTPASKLPSSCRHERSASQGICIALQRAAQAWVLTNAMSNTLPPSVTDWTLPPNHSATPSVSYRIRKRCPTVAASRAAGATAAACPGSSGSGQRLMISSGVTVSSVSSVPSRARNDQRLLAQGSLQAATAGPSSPRSAGLA